MDEYSDFSRGAKIVVVLLASTAAFFGPFGVNIYLPVIPELGRELHVSSTQIMITVTVYLIFQGLSPPVWSPISDSLGRRPVLLVLFAIFVAANVGLGFVRSFGALLGVRIVQAIGGTSAVSIGSGCIADVAQEKERGSYMGLYSMGVLAGPAVSPIIAGAVSQRWGWEAVFYFLAAFSFLYLVVLGCLMPETLRKLVGRGDKRPRGVYRPWIPWLSSGEEPMARVGLRAIPGKLLGPWTMLMQIDVLCIVLMYAALNSGYYTTLSPLSTLLQERYGLSLLQVGLCYIASGVGCMVGSVSSGRILDYVYRREMGKERGALHRVRLKAVPVYLFVFVGSIIGFGWTMEARTHLAGPLVLQFFIGLACMSGVTGCNTLLVDIFPKDAATVSSTANIGRSLAAAGCVAMIDPLIGAIGAGWAFTAVGLVIAGITAGLWVSLWVYGGRWAAKRSLHLAAEDKPMARNARREEEGSAEEH